MSTVPKLDSVDSIYHFLRDDTRIEGVVSSTTPSVIMTHTTRISSPLKTNKRQKKEKESKQLVNVTQTDSTNPIEVLPTGRVRYGPITVNPRKQPSKTLFTGRRSKYEILSGEEEEKRRLRRERNRVAALKCRVKRDDILNDLEVACQEEAYKHTQLLVRIQQLQQKKQQLQSLFVTEGPFIQPTPMVFGNTSFLSSITNNMPAPPLPPHQLQLVANNEEEFTRFIQPSSQLTNSAYNEDQSNYLFNSQIQPISMSSGSFERILSEIPSLSYVDNNNNNQPTTTNTTHSDLFNSAYGSSTCAQQHSSSSEDDAMSSTHRNSAVC